MFLTIFVKAVCSSLVGDGTPTQVVWLKKKAFPKGEVEIHLLDLFIASGIATKLKPSRDCFFFFFFWTEELFTFKEQLSRSLTLKQ